MRNIIKKILRETEFDWLPIQNEIGLEVRVAGKPFHVKKPIHRQDEGVFKSKVNGWNDCYKIVGEEIFTGIDCYIIELSKDYPEVYFPKKYFTEQDFCGLMKESIEDDFSWIEDLNKHTIKKGDVFYIVDGIYEENTLPLDYKPENVRYLFHVTDVFEHSGRFFLEYHYCNPEDVTYNPKDYNTNSCHHESDDVYGTEIEYERALELINNNYWRLMGNNGYYDNINESEEDDLEWTKNLETEPFHHQLIKSKPEVVDIHDVKYIMFNPPVEVGDKRFNKVAYFLEDNEYYPETLESFGKKTSYIEITRHKKTRWINNNPSYTPFGHIVENENGRWDIGPELSEQELYNFSQTGDGKLWAEQFIYVKFRTKFD